MYFFFLNNVKVRKLSKEIDHFKGESVCTSIGLADAATSATIQLGSVLGKPPGRSLAERPVGCPLSPESPRHNPTVTAGHSLGSAFTCLGQLTLHGRALAFLLHPVRATTPGKRLILKFKQGNKEHMYISREVGYAQPPCPPLQY